MKEIRNMKRDGEQSKRSDLMTNAEILGRGVWKRRGTVKGC